MSEDAKLATCSDKVLMVVRGAGFSLPVHVQQAKLIPHEADVWIVTPTMHLMQAQHAVLWDLLATISIRISEGRYAIVDDKEKLAMVCSPVVGVTPEYHYEWKAEPKAAPAEIDISDSDELPLNTYEEAFIREVVDRTRLLTHSQMKVIWNAIVQVAVHWLVSKRKPVNIGFATLIAIPYRSNWKSILAKAFPKSYSCFSRTEAAIEPSMAEMGLLDSLLLKELLEVDPKEHWFNWKVEVIPNKLWDRTVRAMERSRISAGKESYAKFTAASIKRSRAWIIAAYRHFICRAVKPAGKFSPLASTGAQVVVPETRHGGLSRKALERSSGDICYAPAVDWKEPCFTSLVDEEIDRMSQVPDLRSQSAELRITGGYVVGPESTM